LVEREGNILTHENLPFIDLGDKPSSYNPNISEANQVFMVPKSSFRNKLIIKYSFWGNSYVPAEKKLKKYYEKAPFLERNIQQEEFLAALSTATNYMMEYRRKAQNIDKLNISTLLTGLVATVIGSMVLGLYS